jgi:site-specific DNA-methyltransferase (adenine-specific)
LKESTTVLDIHQIWHGKSEELCERFRPGRVHCVITDPPFGVDNQSNMAVTTTGKQMARKIANDQSPEQAIATFNAVMDVLLPRTAPSSDLYIFTNGPVLKDWHEVADSLSRHGYTRTGILVWEKDGPGMGDLEGAWGQGIEYILFLKKGRRLRSDGRRNGVFHIPQVRPNKLIHPHEKPVALLELLLKHSTSEGDFVVDPFGGSGSLVRAAKRIKRNAVAIEMDEFNYQEALKKLATEEDSIF